MRALTALGAALLVAGCVPRDAGFATVRDIVRERTGADVEWRRDGADGDDGAVQQLLAVPLDADGAVRVALLRSPELEAAFAELGVERARLVAAGRPPNPEFEAHIGFVEGQEEVELGFAITTDVTGLLLLPVRRRAASAGLEAARLRAAGAALQVAHAVRLAFYDYQAAEQVVELMGTVLEATAASYEIARRLREAENITALELANERAFYEEARLAAAAAEVVARARREELGRRMGLHPEETDWRIGGRLPDPPEEEPPLAGLEARAIEQSLDLRALELQYRASGRAARASRVEALVPELRAGVGLEREEGPWEIGPIVAVEVPLFDQGQGEVGMARAEMDRLAATHAGRAAAIRAAVRTAWSQVVATARAVRHHREVLLPLRQEIVEESLRQYNAMQLGVFQLIAAKEAEVRAGRDYVEALRAYWLARAALDQLLAGRLVQAPETDLAPAEMRPANGQEGH